MILVNKRTVWLNALTNHLLNGVMYAPEHSHTIEAGLGGIDGSYDLLEAPMGSHNQLLGAPRIGFIMLGINGCRVVNGAPTATPVEHSNLDIILRRPIPLKVFDDSNIATAEVDGRYCLRKTEIINGVRKYFYYGLLTLENNPLRNISNYPGTDLGNLTVNPVHNQIREAPVEETSSDLDNNLIRPPQFYYSSSMFGITTDEEMVADIEEACSLLGIDDPWISEVALCFGRRQKINRFVLNTTKTETHYTDCQSAILTAMSPAKRFSLEFNLLAGDPVIVE